MTNDESIKFSHLAGFQDKQKEAWFTVLNPQSKYILYGGAAGGGKSYFLRWCAVGLALFYFAKYGIKRIPIGLFSEDYPTLRDRQITKIMREFPPWLGELKETNRDGLAFYVAPQYGEGVIMLRNLDDPSKYASVEFAAILGEELTKNKEDTFELLRTRMRFPGVEERKFVGATNPGEVGHGWVKRNWVVPDPNNLDIEQDRFFFVPATYSDNQYNPSDYGLQLQAIKNPQRRKALLEGSWDVFAGQFFTEWNSTIHTCPPFIPKKDSFITGGMDWGRTKPFSFHLSTIQDKKIDGVPFNRAWTFFEVYGTDRTPKEWAAEIKQKLWRGYGLTVDNISWIRGDPAMFTKGQDGSLSIADQFLTEGIRIKPASNDRVGGWEVLHSWLSVAPDEFPYWIITDNCINLVRTLPELVHDDHHVEDVDTNGEDHAPDAMRYMLKHVKWVDARVGGIGSSLPRRRPTFTAKIDPVTGEQFPLALAAFAKVGEKARKVGGSL